MARTFFALLALRRRAHRARSAMVAAPLMVTRSSPRVSRGAKRELTIHLVRILFPGAGLLVASAWCLARPEQPRQVLPLVHSAGGVERRDDRLPCSTSDGVQHGSRWLAMDLAWASVAGSFLQFAVQAPIAFSLSRHPEARMTLTEPGAPGGAELPPGAGQPRRRAAHGLHRSRGSRAGCRPGPSRPWRTPSSSTRCRSACSASRFPRRSCRPCRATRRASRRLRARCARASTPRCARLAFFVVPSAVAFVALGDVIAAALLQRGRFEAERRAVRLGHPRRSVDRAARDDDGAAVFGGALRARRHEAAAAVRARCGWSCAAALGYAVRVVLPPRLGIASAVGRRGADGLVGRRRLDRVRAAARQPQSRASAGPDSVAALLRAAVDRRTRRRGDRLGREAAAAAARSAAAGRRGAAGVRRGVTSRGVHRSAFRFPALRRSLTVSCWVLVR